MCATYRRQGSEGAVCTHTPRQVGAHYLISPRDLLDRGRGGERTVIPPVPGVVDGAIGVHEENRDGGDDVGLASDSLAGDGPLEGKALLRVPGHNGNVNLDGGQEGGPAREAAGAETDERVGALGRGDSGLQSQHSNGGR
jgi:hypothetical protein